MLVTPKLEATPVRLLWRFETRVPLLATADRDLSTEDLRAFAGPDRHPLRGAVRRFP